MESRLRPGTPILLLSVHSSSQAAFHIIQHLHAHAAREHTSPHPHMASSEVTSSRANALFRRLYIGPSNSSQHARHCGTSEMVHSQLHLQAVGDANTHHQLSQRLDNQHMGHKENTVQAFPWSLQPGSDMTACGTKPKPPIFPISGNSR